MAHGSKEATFYPSGVRTETATKVAVAGEGAGFTALSVAEQLALIEPHDGSVAQRAFDEAEQAFNAGTATLGQRALVLYDEELREAQYI